LIRIVSLYIVHIDEYELIQGDRQWFRRHYVSGVTEILWVFVNWTVLSSVACYVAEIN